MPTSTLSPPDAATRLPGLSTAEVAAARAAHGPNVLPDNSPTGLLATLKDVATEPMFLLLLACACAAGAAIPVPMAHSGS